MAYTFVYVNFFLYLCARFCIMVIMRVRESIKYYVLLMLLCLGLSARADERPYLCELGLQGGIGYYVGDAAPHIFMNPREAYGIHFRYKFTKRWAIQAKVSGQRITGNDFTVKGEKLTTTWQTQMANVDVMAEFNFFRFGSSNKYDKRIRPYTPYIFLGIGAGVYSGEIWPTDTKGGKQEGTSWAPYVPVGIGFKWKFHEFVGMNIAWQHNIYMKDNLERRDALDNKHQLNGWNWMNCDLTGMFTVGIVFEFAKAKKECRICNF